MTVEKNSHTFFQKKDLNADGQIETSEPFDVSKYRKFLLHVQITETGNPDNSTVQIKVKFLNPRTGEWHEYQNGPFGYMIWEEDAIPSGEEGLVVCTSGDCASQSMMIELEAAVGVTLNAANYFTVTVAAEFMD